MKTWIIWLSVAAVPAVADTLEDYQRAHAIVTEALAAAGGEGWLERHGGVRLTGRGHYDLAVRLQGMSWRGSDPQPVKETLAVTADGRLAYQSRTHINPDAEEHIRYQYAPDDPLLILDLINRRAFWDSDTKVSEDADRYRRILPPLLLAEAAARPDTLRYVGREDNRHRVLFAPGDITPLTLVIEADSRRLAAVEYLLAMPHLGDSLVRWRFHSPASETALPSGYTIELNGRTLREIAYSEFSSEKGLPGGIELGAPALRDAFVVPEDITVPDKPDPSPPAAAAEATPKRPPYRELAEGIYLAPNVRSGFHHLFVEFDDFVTVVDAPTGWYELQQLPAGNWAGDVTTSSAAEKLIGIVAEAVPDKPIRYLVLSHHHSDHAGSARTFIGAGATVVASPPTAELVERSLEASFELNPDRLTGRSDISPTIIRVEGRHTIRDATRTLELIDVGDNPHVEGMLVAWLPQEKILYQTDLFEPLPERFFPSRERLPVMRWFVDWLDDAGLEPETIYAIHGSARVTPEQLKQIREMEP